MIKTTNRLFIALYLLLSLLVLSGCSVNHMQHGYKESMASFYLKDSHTLTRSSKWVLSTDTAICITTQSDFAFEHHPRTSQSLFSQFKTETEKLFPQVELVQESPMDRCKSSSIIITPKLLVAENNANTLIEIRGQGALAADKKRGMDKIKTQFNIYDIGSNTLIDSFTVTSKARYYAPEDSSPADLIDGAIETFLLALVNH